MKIIAVNGSPRQGWNTEILLQEALRGAAEAGARTEAFNLYDLDYQGCRSCLACKLKGGPNLGRCAVNDGLQPLLTAIDSCDGLILASPIYFGEVSGMMRSFYERLLFQYLSYDDYSKNYYQGGMKTAFIYTTNAPEGTYTRLFDGYRQMLERFFGESRYLLSSETLQVNDYSPYHMGRFDEKSRKQRRETVFPEDRRKAYGLGRDMVG